MKAPAPLRRSVQAMKKITDVNFEYQSYELREGAFVAGVLRPRRTDDDSEDDRVLYVLGGQDFEKLVDDSHGSTQLFKLMG